MNAIEMIKMPSQMYVLNPLGLDIILLSVPTIPEEQQRTLRTKSLYVDDSGMTG